MLKKKSTIEVLYHLKKHTPQDEAKTVPGSGQSKRPKAYR